MRTKINAIIANNNLKNLLFSIIITGFDFLIMWIVVRWYTKEIFAEFIFSMSLTILLDYFRTGLIRSAIIKDLSASPDTQAQNRIVGSGMTVNLITIAIALGICIIIQVFFSKELNGSMAQPFVVYYPWFALAQVPLFSFVCIRNSKNDFFQPMIVNLIKQGILLAWVIISIALHQMSSQGLFLSQIVACGTVSLILILFGKSNLNSVLKSSGQYIRKLLHFGKYTMATTIGGHLLKSSDLFIIGLLMTKPELAIYSIPLKMIDIFNIPLDSFSNVAYPLMAKAHHQGDTIQLRSLFNIYTGTISLISIPIIILLFIFAQPLVYLVGGEQYVQTMTSINIFRIFLIYSLFLTLDRFSGTFLDSISQPQFNFYKVIIMLILNVIGDVIAITCFHSLEMVAWASIITFSSGALIGYSFVHRHLNLKPSAIVQAGWKEVKKFLRLQGARNAA